METLELKTVPKYLPHLSNSWDRMDEYHTLSYEVPFESVLEWFAVIFKKLKINTFEKAKAVREYQLLNIARKDSGGYYGTFEVDFWGGMFHVMGMYGASFNHDWMPKELRYSNNEQLYAKRFEFLYKNVSEKYKL